MDGSESASWRSWWEMRHIGFSELEKTDRTLHRYDVVAPKTAEERE